MLENHHWRTTLSILHQSRLFDHLDEHTWSAFSVLCSSLLLSLSVCVSVSFVLIAGLVYAKQLSGVG